MTKFVGVTFQNSSMVYDFKCDISNIKVGDTVVCHTSQGLSVGLVVCLVDSSIKATQWVIDTVDMTAHQERLMREERKAQLTKELRKRKQKMDEMEQFRQLAEMDPEAGKLFKELMELNGVAKVPELKE